MVRINIMYPKKKGAKFDYDYYLKQHVPMIKECYGEALKRIEVYQGVRGHNISPFITVASMWFENFEEFRNIFEKHREKVMKDRSKFYSVQPVIQVEKQILG